MCVCEYNCNQLFCCFTNRAFGVKAIGFIFFVVHFLTLVLPVYEIQNYRNNVTLYENATFANISMFQNGGYETFLVFAIIFFLVGIVTSVILVWATMQVGVLMIASKCT